MAHVFNTVTMIHLFIGCLLLTEFGIVKGIPTCRTTGEKQNKVVCMTTGAEQYVLQKGLVSDNNQTVGIILKKCRISSINLGSFDGLFYLKRIDLSENNITELKVGVLNGAAKVTYLNLSHNLLETLDLGIFKQNLDLEMLDLSRNVMKNIKQGLFEPLKKLKHLDLSDNQLTGQDLSPHILNGCKKIRYLDFSKNDMSSAPENLLHACQELEFLKLDQCFLTEVPTFATKTNLRTVRKLGISKNHIKRIAAQTTFAKLENLEELDLAWNELENINENVFKPLKILKSLLLRNNLLQTLGTQQFENMVQLRRLDLSHNKIFYISPNSFRGSSIELLNLSDNRFTYLQDNFYLELKNSGMRLKKFFFNDNPWQCACLNELLKELKNYKVEYNSFKYDGKVKVCVTTNQFTCKRDKMSNDFYIEKYYS